MPFEEKGSNFATKNCCEKQKGSGGCFQSSYTVTVFWIYLLCIYLYCRMRISAKGSSFKKYVGNICCNCKFAKDC